MKILYITLPYFADNSLSLIHEARKNGVDMTCLIDLCANKGTVIDIKNRSDKTGIFQSDIYPELSVFNSYLSKEFVYIANYKLGRIHFLSKLKIIIDIFSFIKTERFDVIHTDHTFEGFDKLLYLLGKKLVITIHDPLPHSGMEFSAHTNRERRRAFKYIPKIVIHNSSQLSEFCKLYDISPKRILVNYMSPYSCLNVFKKQIENSRNNNILFFGRISKYKGVEYLCEAMLKVHEVVPSATLTIAGGGDLYFDYSKYENLAFIHLENHYIDTTHLVELLQQCSFVVCPYIDATQSGVVMTCNAFDVPVISTNVGGLPEMIDEEKSGIIVPPKDVDALSSAMIRLLLDEKKLKEMRRYIHNMYNEGIRSTSNIINRYKSFYQL